MVLITHPNNPTTTVFRREAVEALCRFVVKHDLVLAIIQAFQDRIYDGIEFVHPATLPGMWERMLTVCSISKGLGLSGLRIGYIYANDVIMDTLYGGVLNVLGVPCTLSSTMRLQHFGIRNIYAATMPGLNAAVRHTRRSMIARVFRCAPPRAAS